MKIFILIFIAFNLLANDFTQMKNTFDKGNTNRAIAYVRYSAANGDVNAMYNLALLYYSDNDMQKAYRWFESSIKNGGDGQLGIALIRFSKSETPQDYKNVLNALKGIKENSISTTLKHVTKDLMNHQNKASAKEYLQLAELFSSDKLIHKNNELAFLLIQKAAEKEDPKALEIMADAYNTMQLSNITAPRVQNTLLIAIDNYTKAYQLGNFDAMAKLGRLLIIGPRHIKRIKKGQEFISISAQNGSEIAKEMLKNGYKLPSPKQNKNSKKSYHILFKRF